MYVKWTWYEKPIKILNCLNFDTHTHTLHLTLITCQVLTTVTVETSRKVNISSKWLVCVPQPVNNQVSSWLWVLGTIQATNVYVYQLMGAINVSWSCDCRTEASLWGDFGSPGRFSNIVWSTIQAVLMPCDRNDLETHAKSNSTANSPQLFSIESDEYSWSQEHTRVLNVCTWVLL